MSQELSVVGLFAGIGGIELGLHQSGHKTGLLCEIDSGAARVLADHFAGIPLIGDVRELDRLPEADLVAAGFPCQDLSQAGRTAGIRGANSGLVGEVFRLLQRSGDRLRWLLLENVPFMLQLERGKAMRYLVESLESLGFRWAYRVVDTRAFGLPQRRRRVLLLASRTEDPRPVLFSQNADAPKSPTPDGRACGFYWTEGVRGLGWAVDAVPTLKGGSGLGIPSPPAIWMPSGEFVLPDIRDAERLQGFPPNWTEVALTGRAKEGARWKLVGNAVSVPVSRWIGDMLAQTGFADYDAGSDEALRANQAWPSAAWGDRGRVFRSKVSEWPTSVEPASLADFLQYPPRLLSERATQGFLRRAATSSLRFPEGFIDALQVHLIRLRASEAA